MTEMSGSQIRRAAMDLLACREHSAQELSAKLLRRFPGNGQIIEDQLRLLASENLQSDQRYTEAYIRSRVHKGQGPLRINHELSQKGIPQSLILQTIEQAGIQWDLILKELSASKYGNTPPKDEKDKAKRIRFFQYRGFSFEQINALYPC